MIIKKKKIYVFLEFLEWYLFVFCAMLYRSNEWTDLKTIFLLVYIEYVSKPFSLFVQDNSKLGTSCYRENNKYKVNYNYNTFNVIIKITKFKFYTLYWLIVYNMKYFKSTSIIGFHTFLFLIQMNGLISYNTRMIKCSKLYQISYFN